ncbi:unnamed protein product, partial [marine sediment metagenome]
ILCLADTLYQNRPAKARTILSNFYYWLKPGGRLYLTVYDKDKLDPGPREFSQYYEDEKGRKHALTYFEKFTHDAWYEKKAKDVANYLEKV